MKGIFEIIDSEDVIITYNKKQINDLCRLLKNNNIPCKEDDFESYVWVKINDHCAREFANWGPFNQHCPIIEYSKLIEMLK